MPMEKRQLPLLVVTIGLIVLMLISSCKPSIGPEKTDTETPTTNQEVDSSLEIPTPVDGFAVVTGRLLSRETGKSPENAVYLARNVTANDEDLPPYFSFSYTSSPRGRMDENGYFVFKEVPVDQYAILLFEPGGNHHLVENGEVDENRDYLWVNAVPNETLDMGTIYVP